MALAQVATISNSGSWPKCVSINSRASSSSSPIKHLYLFAMMMFVSASSSHEVEKTVKNAQKNDTNLTIKQEVIQYFDDYMQHYNDYLSDTNNTSALKAMVNNYHLPAINISQLGDFLLFESKQQIVTDTKSFIFALKSQGATHINYDKVQIKMLTESTALLSNTASINNKDGTSMFKVGATYVFNKTPEGWKILLRTIHPPETILNLNSEKTS
ncbi:MAG: hypothetical protein L3J24_10830 [Xanthomonadales bacterium]|nr:hypothetical protein [Xanthomonadales bacterium]